MPLHLVAEDVASELENANSVLIVSCPICPPVSLAMQKNTPFIEFFKSGLKTGAFEDYIQSIREPLEQRGVRTGVFRTYAPIPAMCIWTAGQRNRLRKRAKDYNTVVVLGCNTALYTAQQALADTDCQVIQAMRPIGMTNAVMKIQFPMTITLKDKVRIGQGDDIEKMA